MQDDLLEAVEWGGSVWEEQVARGLAWLGSLDGLRVLDIGARFGGMAILMASRGAEVTALDINDEPFEHARAAAAARGVADRIAFTTYSGDPEELPGGFDVVFTKSTLVLFPDLSSAATSIAERLLPGGRLLAVENARGPLPVHIARIIRRRSLRPHGANYFTRRSIDTISPKFRIDLLHWTSAPPTVVIGAIKA